MIYSIPMLKLASTERERWERPAGVPGREREESESWFDCLPLSFLRLGGVESFKTALVAFSTAVRFNYFQGLTVLSIWFSYK